MSALTIADAALATGLSAKTIRYYEDAGLIMPARAANGYRAFEGVHIQRLTFIAQARRLGFSVEECRSLLALYDDKSRASSDVKRLAEARIADIEQRIHELTILKDTLGELVDSCCGDDRPDCPILKGLEGGVLD